MLERIYLKKKTVTTHETFKTVKTQVRLKNNFQCTAGMDNNPARPSQKLKYINYLVAYPVIWLTG